MNGQYGTREIPMSGRHKAARAFVIVGGVLLFRIGVARGTAF